MGRERPHSDTTECITRSDGAQDSQIHVFFEVPMSVARRHRVRLGSRTVMASKSLTGLL